ncbi:MAG: TatD family hydrolase [Bacteroidales bacterium]|nr:TatD family hydrolase [Bacteroidales bacterium]
MVVVVALHFFYFCTMFLVDTHTHIYLPDFDNDRSEVIHRARQSHVCKMLLPNIDRQSLPLLNKICQDWPGVCYPMIGLHPTSVDNSDFEMPFWIEDELIERRYVAIGEVGIDLYWEKRFRDQQVEVFKYQIQLAVRHGLPLVIHSREATSLILEVLEPFKGKVQGVFHCFSGTESEAARAIEIGFLLGVGGVITYKNSPLPAIVSKFGLNHLLLETDAPYLPPVPHRGKRNEPSHTFIVAGFIAKLLSVPLEDVATATSHNALKLFSL